MVKKVEVYVIVHLIRQGKYNAIIEKVFEVHAEKKQAITSANAQNKILEEKESTLSSEIFEIMEVPFCSIKQGENK
ncbi:hypothetical protein HOE37_06700 [Candidatus Woesearchaeota archaeon]|jgi:hypothetical protein|nr:hypothetical protein [Candidatus Woesearchaeota archaeon]